MEALQQELFNVKKLLAERDAMIEVTGVYDVYLLLLMNIYVKTPAISLNLLTFLFIKKIF